MSADNTAVVRRFFDELCNGRRSDVAEEIVAPDFTSYGPNTPPAGGPAGARERVAVYQDALEGHWDVQEVIAAGAHVTVRWIGRGRHVGELMGVAPTGREIAVDAISIFEVTDGLIRREWTVWDALGLLQQLGAVPVTP